MLPESDKLLCAECNSHLRTSEVLIGGHPFMPSETISGCPHCRGCTGFDRACDEPGCWELACCGFKSGDRPYRMTCHKHYVSVTAPKSGEVLLESPLGTQQSACGNRQVVANPTTIRVQ